MLIILLTTIHVIVCMVLIIVVLLQHGKSADIAATFGGVGSQTAFGPRGAASALSSATTWCAIMFMVCAFALTVRSDKAASQSGSVLQKVSQPAPKPAAPATTPVVPQSNTHDSLPGQQPSSQPPSSQAPATSQPATSQPQSGKPATGQQSPASSQPAPAPTPTKKP